MPPFLWIVTYIHTLVSSFVSSLMLRSIHSCSYFSIPYSFPSVSMLNVVYRYASQWNKVHVALHAGMHWPSLGSCVSALPTCECPPGDRRWDLSDIWSSWCQGHCMEAWQVCIVMDTVLSMMKQCVRSPQWRCGCVNSLHMVNLYMGAHMVFWLIVRAFHSWNGAGSCFLC